MSRYDEDRERELMGRPRGRGRSPRDGMNHRGGGRYNDNPYADDFDPEGFNPSFNNPYGNPYGEDDFDRREPKPRGRTAGPKSYEAPDFDTMNEEQRKMYTEIKASEANEEAPVVEGEFDDGVITIVGLKGGVVSYRKHNHFIQKGELYASQDKSVIIKIINPATRLAAVFKGIPTIGLQLTEFELKDINPSAMKGRVVNAAGNIIKDLISDKVGESVSGGETGLQVTEEHVEFDTITHELAPILETGIKAIDFFTPIKAGDLVSIKGAAGSGKSVTMESLLNVVDSLNEKQAKFDKELASVDIDINDVEDRAIIEENLGKDVNLSYEKATMNANVIFVGIGERDREANALYENQMKEETYRNGTNQLRGADKIFLVSPMSDTTEAARVQTVDTLKLILKHFNDLKQSNIIIMDNLYRFLQAQGSIAGLSGETLVKNYSANLVNDIDEIKSLVGRKTTKLRNSDEIGLDYATTLFTTNLKPTDMMGITDHAVESIDLASDVVIDLESSMEYYPKIDFTKSRSNNISEDRIDAEHHRLRNQVVEILTKADDLSLQAMINDKEANIIKKAKILKSYFSQNLTGAKQFSTDPRAEYPFVKLDKVLVDIKAIVDEHKYDHISDSEIDAKSYTGAWH